VTPPRQALPGEPSRALRLNEGPLGAPSGGGAVTPGALAAVLEPQREAFLAFLRNRLPPADDAEDLLQRALLRAVEKAATLRDVESAVPWFYRVLRRTLADAYARHADDERRLSGLDEAWDEPAPERVEFCKCTVGLLRSLRPDYADILRRVDVEGESLAEVARASSITANNATVRLHRARKALREAVVRCCGVESTRAYVDCTCDCDCSKHGPP
jgi:RNA polymerase sigma factor (sigma-70 family)